MISCLSQEGNLFVISTKPVFQVDQSNPTADKPQSKLWYQDNCWWALLPRSTRPSLWQRSKAGWTEHLEIAQSLQGVPGRSDVWAEENGVTAVGVGSNTLVIFRITLLGKSPEVKWQAHILAKLTPVDTKDSIETATITRDSKGIWFVSAVADRKVFLWSSTDNAENWTPPIILADSISSDDICVVSPLPDGVGVIWSDQNRDAVFIVSHKDGEPVGK